MSTIRELKKLRKQLKRFGVSKEAKISVNLEIKELQKKRFLKLISEGRYGILKIKNRNKYLFGGLANGSK